jgi:hypothetical protein
MGPLFPGGKLGAYLRETGVLRLDESLQMVGIVHGVTVIMALFKDCKDGNDRQSTP